MLELLIAFDLIFIILMMIDEDKTKSIIYGAIAAFMGFGAYRLSFDGTNYQYAFIPLAFIVISVVWSIYLIYGIIVENNKKDWGTDIEGMDKV